jgi:hypothetical protein
MSTVGSSYSPRGHSLLTGHEPDSNFDAIDRFVLSSDGLHDCSSYTLFRFPVEPVEGGDVLRCVRMVNPILLKCFLVIYNIPSVGTMQTGRNNR